MPNILFLTSFSKYSGGQRKVQDYFVHCLSHPRLQPFLYFTPKFVAGLGAWNDIPEERIVDGIELARYEIILVTGKDWKFLPKELDRATVIGFHQSLSELDPERKTRRFLSRPALRICASPAVHDAIASEMAGEAIVIPNGIPLELFRPSAEKEEHSVLIWGRKNPRLAERLRDELLARGLNVKLLLEFLPREKFARELATRDIFVGLPHCREGFYLPALEAMASGCAVVCSDARGNRSFCRHGETCLMPEFDDYSSHLAMIDRLLRDRDLKEQLRRAGYEAAQSYSLEAEREQFYRVLHEKLRI